ncbi:hypothetical protein D5S18_33695 [Nocardia panacis]|uniref:Uncharacterized protein n=1 Tax=Nocardia panacis TaxID=2340916 RepID=A0A3A4K6R0_9NOCA|nr:hypothetical protein [Nocardia panacis]RJO68369.1 hypothetical protein D5S18_33695 [Nocardia panacis]
MRHAEPSGLIAPGADPGTAHQAAATVLEMQQAAPQAIQDVALPQLPADLPPIEPPAFVLSRKVSEEQAAAHLPGGLPGLGGGQQPDAQDILSGVHHELTQAAEHANNALQYAAQPIVGVAQQAAGQVGGALGAHVGASATPAAAAPAVQSAASVPGATMPADPVAALLQGLQLPALPGIDQLFKPILDLLGSFGTGIMGMFNPATLLSEASKVIDVAMQVGKGSMSTVDELWQSQAAHNAQAASQRANNDGQETSKRGTDMADLTEKAAAVVQKGNAQLVGVATSFATQATALAPVILTPPAQASLIATATEHLGQAVGIVNATRGELGGHTAQLGGLVQQMVAQSGLPAPQEVAAAVAKNVGEPILNQAKDLAQSAGDTATKAAGLGDTGGSIPSTATTPAGLTGGGTSGAHHGSSSGAPGAVPGFSPGRSGGGPGGGGTGLGSSSSPKVTAIPGAAMAPGLRGGAGLPGEPVLGGRPGAGGAAGGGNSFMGGAPAAAGAQRNSEDEHSRTVQPYQSRTGNDDLTGPLGESTPDVIGATHPDEMVSDYEQDQF